LVDEVLWFTAPKLLGGDAHPRSRRSPAKLDDAPAFGISRCAVGADLRSSRNLAPAGAFVKSYAIRRDAGLRVGSSSRASAI
jgi:hypothetical protein